MTNRDDLPALGTAEAAVQSCVRLISSVTAQPTELMGYYLDLYYQVRRSYEIEAGAEDEPQAALRLAAARAGEREGEARERPDGRLRGGVRQRADEGSDREHGAVFEAPADGMRLAGHSLRSPAG